MSNWGTEMLMAEAENGGQTRGISQTTHLCISHIVHDANILKSRSLRFPVIYLFIRFVMPHVIEIEKENMFVNRFTPSS
jgi:hypothetical protein